MRSTCSANELIGHAFVLTVKAIMLELSGTCLAHLLLHKRADMYKKREQLSAKCLSFTLVEEWLSFNGIILPPWTWTCRHNSHTHMHTLTLEQMAVVIKIEGC